MFATGIKRIQYTYRDNIVKPSFSSYSNSIEVILPVLDKDPRNLEPQELLVFTALQENGPLTRSEIQKQSDLNKSKTLRVLNALIEKKIVVKIGEGRNTKYQLA